MTERRDEAPVAAVLLGVAVVAMAYLGFFRLNQFLFDTLFKVNDHVSWIFLPAAIRMVAVLLLGWPGVLGLALGSLLVDADLLMSDTPQALTQALVSSVPSLLAMRAVQRMQGLRADLAGMTGQQVLGFGLGGAAASSLAHTCYFALRAESIAPFTHLVPMFIGDLLGTLLMLYAAALVLRRVRVPRY